MHVRFQNYFAIVSAKKKVKADQKKQNAPSKKKGKSKEKKQKETRPVFSPFIWAIVLVVAIPAAFVPEANDVAGAVSAWFLGTAGLLATPTLVSFGWINRLEKRTKKPHTRFSKRFVKWRKRSQPRVRNVAIGLLALSLASMAVPYLLVRDVLDPESSWVTPLRAIFLAGFVGVYLTVVLGFVAVAMYDSLDEDAPVEYISSERLLTRLAESEWTRMTALLLFLLGTILGFYEAYAPSP